VGYNLTTQIPATRARILARVQAAVAAGLPVYDYIRNVNHADTRAAILIDTGGKFHFWMFGLASGEPISAKRYPAGLNRVEVQWDVHGYMAVQDATASEKAHDLDALAVLDAIEGDRKLVNGGTPTVSESGPAQRVQGGHVVLGDVLCHYARLSLTTVLNPEY
jgi:hypothetical protein